jgi:Beta/Gamma crystallin
MVRFNQGAHQWAAPELYDDEANCVHPRLSDTPHCVILRNVSLWAGRSSSIEGSNVYQAWAPLDHLAPFLLKSPGWPAAEQQSRRSARDGNITAWEPGSSFNHRRCEMPHVILFEHANFHGQHKHVFGREPNLNAGDDNFFNDRVSSIVVLESTWAFYRNANFNGQYSRTLGPGLYPDVRNVDIQNDDMSSLQPVWWFRRWYLWLDSQVFSGWQHGYAAHNLIGSILQGRGRFKAPQLTLDHVLFGMAEGKHLV